MSMRRGAIFALFSGCLALGACAPVDRDVASAPAPTIAEAPVTEPPSSPPKPITFPARPQMPALQELKLVRKNIAEAPETLTVEAAEIPDTPTKIIDQAAAERLFGNSGVTLQWITWDRRGAVFIAIDENGVWWLTGRQNGDGGSGLKLEGYISEIGSDYFLFEGEITIAGAPDAERFCDQNKQWRFGITQNRKYWRLREFEWCDRLTDYIDIYF